jgi:hypothetical protein
MVSSEERTRKTQTITVFFVNSQRTRLSILVFLLPICIQFGIQVAWISGLLGLARLAWRARLARRTLLTRFARRTLLTRCTLLTVLTLLLLRLATITIIHATTTLVNRDLQAAIVDASTARNAIKHTATTTTTTTTTTARLNHQLHLATIKRATMVLAHSGSCGAVSEKVNNSRSTTTTQENTVEIAKRSKQLLKIGLRDAIVEIVDKNLDRRTRRSSRGLRTRSIAIVIVIITVMRPLVASTIIKIVRTGTRRTARSTATITVINRSSTTISTTTTIIATTIIATTATATTSATTTTAIATIATIIATFSHVIQWLNIKYN